MRRGSWLGGSKRDAFPPLHSHGRPGLCKRLHNWGNEAGLRLFANDQSKGDGGCAVGQRDRVLVVRVRATILGGDAEDDVEAGVRQHVLAGVAVELTGEGGAEDVVQSHERRSGTGPAKEALRVDQLKGVQIACFRHREPLRSVMERQDDAPLVEANAQAAVRERAHSPARRLRQTRGFALNHRDDVVKWSTQPKRAQGLSRDYFHPWSAPVPRLGRIGRNLRRMKRRRRGVVGK
mmetsp:Transcript_3260/g.10164  ORF Transcript_3260/g.10164 Transcript_3260/m.10164 type:complete len:235 (-) Transcript_3260:70-774(-)